MVLVFALLFSLIALAVSAWALAKVAYRERTGRILRILR